MTFPERMKNEAFVDNVEDVVQSMKAHLSRKLSLHLEREEFPKVHETANTLEAVTIVEEFVFSVTPRFS